jgi:hypothetical protein
MAKYLQRSYPNCNGYLGIVVPERKAKVPVQAINESTVPYNSQDRTGFMRSSSTATAVLLAGNGL